MNKALVSVIIPTYGRSERLKEAIESVLVQTYKNYEVLVVDDNDSFSRYRRETEKMMKYYEKNEKVKYFKHKKNKNGAAARNTGIKNSKGEYITFLDDDDIYLKDKILKQVAFLEINTKINGIYCGRIQNNKVICGKYFGDISREILSLEFTPTTPALMFRRQVVMELNGFDESYKRHQDFEFLLRFLKKNIIMYISDPLIKIGFNNGENTLIGKELEKNKEKFLKQFNKEIEILELKYKGAKKKIYISHYVPVLMSHIKNKNFSLAFKVYFNLLRLNYIEVHYKIYKYMKKYFYVKRIKNEKNI